MINSTRNKQSSVGLPETMEMDALDTVIDSGSTSKSGLSFSGSEWSQFGGSVAGLVTGYLGMRASDLDVERENKATMINLASQSDAFALDTESRLRYLDQLDDSFSDAMTSEGLETLKLEATARATAAESGSTSMADTLVDEVEMESSFRKAELNRAYENELENTLFDSSTSLFNYEQRIESILFNMKSPTEAALQTATSGISATTSGMRIGSIIGSF